MDQQDGHAGQEENISDIEDPGEDLTATSGPIPSKGQFATGEEMQEITYSSDQQTIPEIAKCPGQYESDSDMGQGTSSIGLPSEDVDRNADGNQREADEEPALFTSNAEYGS